MPASAKSAQLQIRVSPAEKAAIQRAARRAGLDMSAYVLTRVLP
ncbi:MAG: plasmid mobilization protein, partial [Candidatus Rokuibacteriota bacterium]